MSLCCVPNCPSGSKKFEGKRHFFGFPRRNEEMMKKWLRAIPRANLNVTKNTRVCETHFDPDDVWKHEKLVINGDTILLPRVRWKLNPEAVPMVFPGCPKYLSKKIPRKRQPPKERAPPKNYSKKSSSETPVKERVRVCKPFEAASISLPSKAWNWHETDGPEGKKRVTFLEVAEDGFSVTRTVVVTVGNPAITYYINSQRCHSAIPRVLYHTGKELEQAIAAFSKTAFCSGLAEPRFPAIAHWAGGQSTERGWRSDKCLYLAVEENGQCDNCIWVENYMKDLGKSDTDK